MDGQRPGIRRAIDTITKRVSSGEITTSIVLPTRYGKSNVIIVSIKKLIDAGLICCGVVLSPFSELRTQIVDIDKVADRLRRGGMDAGGFSVRIVDRFSVGMRPNGESCLSMTTQGAHYYGEIISQWIASEKHKTGLPVALFVDECDSITDGADASQWGFWVQEFIKAGHPVILLTATPERSDDERIIGFEYEETVVDPDVVRYLSHDSPLGEEYVRVEKWMAEKYRLHIKADYKLEFHEAWGEDPLPICKISSLPFDVSLSDVGGVEGSTVEMMSQLSEWETRRHMSRIVRHPKVIARCVEGVAKSIRDFRATGASDVCGMVFSSFDVGDNQLEKGRHAKDIQRAFRQIAPELRTVILTYEMKNADEEMRAFRAGAYDVAIVKRMGSVGLDCPRIKVVGDLSPDRQYRSWVQRINRGSTIYGALRWCDLHYPADIIAKNFWVKLCGPLGEGAISEEERLAMLHGLQIRLTAKVKEYDKPKDPGPGDEFRVVAGVEDADFSDSEGREARAAEAVRVAWFFEKVPQMKGIVSEAQIAESFREVMITPEIAGKAPRDISAEIEDRKAELHDIAKAIAITRKNRLGIAYSEAIESVWYDAKYMVGWKRRLEDIVDLNILKRLKDALESLARQERRTA